MVVEKVSLMKAAMYKLVRRENLVKPEKFVSNLSPSPVSSFLVAVKEAPGSILEYMYSVFTVETLHKLNLGHWKRRNLFGKLMWIQRVKDYRTKECYCFLDSYQSRTKCGIRVCFHSLLSLTKTFQYLECEVVFQQLECLPVEWTTKERCNADYVWR